MLTSSSTFALSFSLFDLWPYLKLLITGFSENFGINFFHEVKLLKNQKQASL